MKSSDDPLYFENLSPAQKLEHKKVLEAPTLELSLSGLY
jgi:hypothetical protein